VNRNKFKPIQYDRFSQGKVLTVLTKHTQAHNQT